MEEFKLHQEIADNLLFPLWQCVDEKFKTDNPKDVWRYFENFIKTSATSPNLTTFFGAFKRLCPFDWMHKHEKAVLHFIQNANSDDVLEILRGDDCAFVILLTRQRNQERKQDLKYKNSLFA